MVKLLRKPCIVLILLGLLTLLFVGCKVSGGGFILSTAGGTSKAHFAFCGSQDGDREGPITGDFQYSDKGTSGPTVRFHGIVTSYDNQTFDPAVEIDGTYTPQPKKLGAGGTFVAIVEDMGAGKPLKGDTLSIVLTGGVFGGYANAGPILGGNITSDQSLGAVC